jgi:hypothetical protein
MVWPQRGRDCTGQRPVWPLIGMVRSVRLSDGCHAVPLNPLIRWMARNLRRGKDYDSGLRMGDESHTRIPLTLNRPPLVCIQLRTDRHWESPEKEMNQLAGYGGSLMAHTPSIAFFAKAWHCRSNYETRRRKHAG